MKKADEKPLSCPAPPTLGFLRRGRGLASGDFCQGLVRAPLAAARSLGDALGSAARAWRPCAAWDNARDPQQGAVLAQG